MATGTGKTYTAFQIIWRLWKSKQKKRILLLADRNILVDQTKNNDFKPFSTAMTKISKRQIDKSYEIYLSLYQAVTGNEEERNIYKQFSPDFFDLVVIDECRRRLGVSCRLSIPAGSIQASKGNAGHFRTASQPIVRMRPRPSASLRIGVGMKVINMKCPSCADGGLVRDTRDLPYTYQGIITIIPSVTGDFCLICSEIILDAAESERVSKLMIAFNQWQKNHR